MKLPFEDKHLHTKQSFLDEIAALLGGYAAEKLVFKELTTGASNDLKLRPAVARKLVMNYGMSEEIGPIVLGDQHEMVFLGQGNFRTAKLQRGRGQNYRRRSFQNYEAGAWPGQRKF